jgi:hypothetical protein
MELPPSIAVEMDGVFSGVNQFELGPQIRGRVPVPGYVDGWASHQEHGAGTLPNDLIRHDAGETRTIGARAVCREDNQISVQLKGCAGNFLARIALSEQRLRSHAGRQMLPHYPAKISYGRGADGNGLIRGHQAGLDERFLFSFDVQDHQFPGISVEEPGRRLETFERALTEIGRTKNFSVIRHGVSLGGEHFAVL